MTKGIEVQPPRQSGTEFIFKLAWRYFTGAHLDGKRRTDATWTKPGSRPNYHISWWNCLPRRTRMAWRHGMFWPAILVLFGLYENWRITLWFVTALIPFGIEQVYYHVKRVRIVSVVGQDNTNVIEFELPPEIQQVIIDEIGTEDE